MPTSLHLFDLRLAVMALKEYLSFFSSTGRRTTTSKSGIWRRKDEENSGGRSGFRERSVGSAKDREVGRVKEGKRGTRDHVRLFLRWFDGLRRDRRRWRCC